MKVMAFSLILAVALSAFGQASDASSAQPPQAQTQQPSQREGQRGWPWQGRGIGGTIASIGSDSLTITTRDGGTATVKLTPETRLMKDRQPAKLSDFKVGDRVMVRGELTGENTWKAEMVGSGGMGGGRGGPDFQRMREDLGKEFIAGEVKAIDGLKLTIHRIDGQDQTIEVDENTSFRKGRESITFPEIRVGDRVMGRGKLNAAGVFVPEMLNVGDFGERPGGAPQPPVAPPNQ